MNAQAAYDAGYASGIKGILQNTNYSASSSIQTSYDSGYNAGNQLYIQAFADGYKDASISRARVIDLYPTYAANEYLLAAYYQGYDHYKDAVQTTTLKSEWYARTASTGADRSEAVAKDSQNNIYYGGYTAVASTVYNKTNVNASMGWSATTQTGFIVKQTREGTSQWASRFTSSSTVGRVYSIVCDSSDNVYSYGVFNGTLTLYDSSGVAYGTTLAATSSTNSAFLVKHNSAGKIQWVTRIVPSASTGVVTAATIAYDATTDTICVNGSYSDTSVTQSSIFVYNSSGTIHDTLSYSSTNSSFLIKYSTSGACQWAAAVKQPQLQNMIPTTNGLIAYLDPANPNSYSGVGATMTSLVGSVTGTLRGSYTYANGTMRLNNTSATFGSNNATLQLNSSITFRTISMWVYIHSMPADFTYLLDCRAGATDAYIFRDINFPSYNIGAFWNGGTLYKNGSSAQSLTWSNIQTFGSWQHITVISPSLTGTDDITFFGGNNLTNGLNCTFGPIQVYNRVLTEAENLANYNATKSRFIVDVSNIPIPTTSGLVAYFDPANAVSYPGSDTTMKSLVGSATGTLGGAYSYSGGTIRLTNTSATLTANTAYFVLTSSVTYRTISLWVYIHSLPTSAMMIDARYTGSDSYVYNHGLQIVGVFSGGTLYKNGGSAIALTAANVFTTGAWQHLTFVTTSSITGSNLTFFNNLLIPPAASSGKWS
jgi:hypothetical protein